MRNRQEGVAIVEFALVLPFILLLTFMPIEYGRAIWQYNTLTKSVRDGVRYIAAQTPGDPTEIAKAKNLVVYGNLAGTGTPLALGLSTSNVPTPTWQTAGSDPVINTVTIRVTGYTFNSMVVSVLGLPFGALTFPDIQATMRSQL